MRILRVATGLQVPSLMVVALCAGCAGDSPLVPVSGKVTVNGQPLTTGTLVFKPDRAKGNTTPFEPAAVIQADGSYTVYTNYKPGAPKGAYRVAVEASVAVDPEAAYPTRRSLIDPRYNDAATSGLAVTVVEQPESGTYDLPLSR